MKTIEWILTKTSLAFQLLLERIQLSTEPGDYQETWFADFQCPALNKKVLAKLLEM